MALPPPNNLDKNAVALTRAMRTIESGGDYNAKGKSGEYGAYQYIPATWKERASKYLKDANAPQTPENQNFVQYNWVKEQKDLGLTPDQILAKHNSGGTQYQGKVGVNKYGVKYDVPAYVKRGTSEFEKEVQKLGGRVNSSSAQSTPTSTAGTPEQPKQPGFFQSLAQGISSPFLKAGANLVQLGQGVGNLAQAGYSKLTGDEAGYQRNIQEGLKATDPNRKFNAGYLGEIQAPKNAKEAIGTGAQIGLSLAPLGRLSETAISSFAPSLAKTVIPKGVSTIGSRALQKFTTAPGLANLTAKGLEFGTVGAGFTAASNLADSKPITDNLGASFGIGFVLPFAGAGVGAALRPAEKLFGGVSRVAGSFGTPTEKAISQEVSRLKGAYDDVFSARESTNAKAQFLRDHGKDPAEILSKAGIVPGLEYNGGKTIMRTKVEGGAVDKVTGMIEERAQQIQGTADKVQQTVGRNVPVASLEQRALQEARKNSSGVEMTSLLNKVKSVFASIREKYGEKVGVGDLNQERIAANKLTGAWDRPTFERDAFSVVGNVFRSSIDDQVGDDIVRNLNSEIGDLIAGRKLLIALDGKGIGGGRLTNLVASTAGSILGQLTAKDSGAVVQVISSLAGALGVKAFLRYIQSGAFGGPATERILSHLAENRSVLNELIAKEPQIVKNAWLKQIDDFIKSGPKLLNAPAEKGNRPFISGDKPIPLGGATTFEKQAPNVNYRNSLPPVPKDLAPKIGAISKDLEPLATEARKYKSAEDFVQSSGLKVEYAKNKLKVAEDAKPITVTVYHGSPDARFAEEFNPSKKGYFKDAPDLLPDNTQWNELYGSTGSGFKTGTGVYEGISFTDDFKVAKSYADKPAFDSQNSVPMVLERTVTLKKPKVIDVANGEWKISLERTIEQAKKEGYDGIIFKNIKDNYHPSTTQKPSNNIIVFSPDQLKTKSQLTDFYNKAVGKLPSKPPKLR